MSSFILFIGQNLNLKETYQFLESLVIILVKSWSGLGVGEGKKQQKKENKKSLTGESLYNGNDNGITATNF